MERPILTDVSPAGLRAAIEADIVASRIYGGDLPPEDLDWRNPVVRIVIQRLAGNN